MTSINNVFNFGRSLPEPFDILGGYKKVKVSSKYGTGTEATLNCTMIKAVQALCDCMSGKGEGAVGIIDHRMVAEYKSSVSPDAYHLVVYDSKSGNILASVYDKSTEMIEAYVMHSSKRDGAAVIFAAMPVFMDDDEFKENFDEYYQQRVAGYPDFNKAKNAMAMMCDNAYRRVKDETCPAHVKLEVDKSGNLMRVATAQIDAGNFIPKEVYAGEFEIFAKTGKTTIKKAGILVDKEDFAGKYAFSERTFTPDEESLIPEIPDWYIISKDIVEICRHAKESTGKPMQMRNFLLRGPAGTGKTMGAKAIAAGLHLPYMKYTCSAGTEIFDLIGMIIPDTVSGSTGDEMLDRELDALGKMGGITYENVSKIMGLPGLDDMDYDPGGVYEKLTGVKKEDATSQDCMSIVLSKVTTKVQALMKRENHTEGNGQSYTYMHSDLIKALGNGYVVEIQEPTTIVQPGVLVGLNSMLEQSGSITLANGEIIKRHPDAVVVITTNISYEGCRGMNQSVIDRMSLVKDIELPEPEVMVQRVMSVTGAEDENMVSQMVQVVNDLSDYCRNNCITDGSYGMRSLIDWVISTEITGNPYESALYTIISKATANEEDREALITSVLEPVFASSMSMAS